MLLLGTQYYRPPFPERRYWADDLRRMADAGLNTVQLWVVWAWVEAVPGEYRFDDYDELVSLADRAGLGVVLSTIAAVHPYWIHREVPGSEMVDNFGHKVVSSNRGECHYGLTPGGCFDHPGVWQRMAAFLTAVAERYRDAPRLRGWDAWNELRWNVLADGLVCYCEHTLALFRKWLGERYGGLEGLNAAWKRRYGTWDEVRPGKMPRSPYTESIAFQQFLTHRSNEHARARYEVIKNLDPERPVTVHGAHPCVLHRDAYPIGTALHRGNDWDLADGIDGVGCSSFPRWKGMDLHEYLNRITCSASAARAKRLWLSELQGGRGAQYFKLQPAVPAAEQQRWIWGGVSRGAEAVLFWCWRDEVFGSESGGFGLTGRDGLAGERLAALRRTGEVLRGHAPLLSAYRPDPAPIGVFFSPRTYSLQWAADGDTGKAMQAVEGYMRALCRRNLPFRVVEEEHLDELCGVTLLLLPRTLALEDTAAEALAGFVRRGGTLVCESECGAFDGRGLYREPGERFTAALTGTIEQGRRPLPEPAKLTLQPGDASFTVGLAQWTTPFEQSGGEVWAAGADGPLAVCAQAGRGRVVLLGSYLGEAYLRAARDPQSDCALGFEGLLENVAALAGVATPAEVRAPLDAEPPVHVTCGRSGDRRLVFVFGDAPQVSLRLKSADTRRFTELITGATVDAAREDDGVSLCVRLSDWGVAVLAGLD